MDISEKLQKQIIDAVHDNQALQIIGNNTKAFYGRKDIDQSETRTLPLHVAEHSGILDYQNISRCCLLNRLFLTAERLLEAVWRVPWQAQEGPGQELCAITLSERVY
jgi:hypothetical protein